DANAPTVRAQINAGIARALCDASVSSLRFDKRGVGASGGDFLSAGMSENLADARAALGWLQRYDEGLPLFVIGHSEGALYAARLAAEQRLAGATLLSMAARRGQDVLEWQLRAILPTLP